MGTRADIPALLTAPVSGEPIVLSLRPPNLAFIPGTPLEISGLNGSEWLHLRLCRICGHVGCCDDSPNRHATKHFHATRHPIIEGYDPPEGWGWCYVDEVMLDLSNRATPHNGRIPRYY